VKIAAIITSIIIVGILLYLGIYIMLYINESFSPQVSDKEARETMHKRKSLTFSLIPLILSVNGIGFIIMLISLIMMFILFKDDIVKRGTTVSYGAG